ncbi:MAG: Bcr/CflA family drug resistance efflux transporter [Marinosulfonomonas sp.]|nr:MAG: Bcr/CflA family drug resistance efflux transporter [Marinosulfonomonas sp.]
MSSEPTRNFLNRSTPPHIITLVLITGMAAMVMNMFLPSLPAMTEYFHADYRVTQLSVALYLGFVAILQVFIGPLSDRYGRRPVLLIGMAVFLVATVGCIFAPSIEIFLVFRMVQATVGVAMVLSRAIARDMYSQAQAASMIGYITMGMAIIPMLSPAIGGLLDEKFGWQANFWVFLILGTAVFWLTWADVGETNTNQSSSFRQQVSQYPELLLSPRFWGYCLAAAFASGAFFAYLGGAPFIGNVVYGLQPSKLGLFFGAPALGYMVGNFLTGRFSTRFGVNRMVLWGAVISTTGVFISLALSLNGLGSIYTFFGFMIFVGLGNGLILPNATAGMLSVRPHLAGTASGLGGAIMMGGGAALSALAGSLLGPESGPFPLLWIMFIVSLLSVISILLVIAREKVKRIA